MEDSTSPILKLKKHFNRPRPKELAKKTQHKPRDYRDGFYENAVIPIRSFSSRRVSWRSFSRHVSLRRLKSLEKLVKIFLKVET